jgi:rhomboid family GlyGly-CTERM serine protease
MNLFRLKPSLCVALALTLLMLGLSIAADFVFSLLSLERTQVAQGQFWRLLTANFVHFGWAHTLMNLGAFLLCSFALLSDFSIKAFAALIVSCCLVVGICIYVFNPEYETYAGLSGALHGFIVAGVMVNKRHKAWVNSLLVALVFAKVINENRPGYQSNELQDLLPVAVAYSAHLYGALAGLTFGAMHLMIIKSARRS